jgi:molybdopterin molybdotransferase
MKEGLIDPARAWALIEKGVAFKGLVPGQRLPQGLRARHPYPRFDNCALDGYAVRAADLKAASKAAPAALRVVADQFAGARRRARMKAGQAVQTATGAPLPPGADTVVPYELCRRQGRRVLFTRPPQRGANVRRRGEDVRRGTALAPKGAALSPALLGLAAACGSLPRLLAVNVLVSGDELSGSPKAGQIFDANGPLLQGLLAQAGLGAMPIQRVPDALGPALRLLRRAMDADLLILAGGMSVGRRDVLRPALRRLGVRQAFAGVAQKPGKPLYLGRHGRGWVLGLPGNPAAAFSCFHAYGLPLLRGLAGLAARPRWSVARLAAALPAPGGKALFLKAAVDAKGRLRVLSGQGSHQLRALAQGNALLYLPAGRRPLRRGARVRCLRLDWEGL